MFVLKQGQTTQRTKINKPKNQASTSFEKRKTNVMAQMKNGTHKEIYLPLNYNDNINMRQMLNTKNMQNILKQYLGINESHLANIIIGRWKTHKNGVF